MTIANCFHRCRAIIRKGEEDQADPFADLEESQDADMGRLSEPVTQLTPDIAAEQYLQDEESLSTCDLFKK